MKFISRLANGVVKLCTLLSVVCVIGILVLAVLDVILRTVFNAPIIGATEISQMLMVGAVLGTGGGILTDQNIQVDIVVNALPKKVQSIIGLCTVTASMVIYGIIGWRLLVESGAAIKFGKAFSLLKVPYFPFYWLLALGMFGGCVGGAIYLARIIKDLRKKKDKEGDENVL